MKSLYARLLVSGVCLLLGFLMVSQFRSQRPAPALSGQSPTDQASYISQLYSSNETQRADLDRLRGEISKIEQGRTSGSSSLIGLLKDLQSMRVINGDVDVVGPGVEVRVKGGQSVTQMLQDLVNELRSSGAEAIGLNGIRLVTRSVIEEGAGGAVLVDKQAVTSPYLLDAIGDPATLQNALVRKKGVIDLLQQEQGNKLEITVTRRGEGDPLLHLPKTAMDRKWQYAHPLPAQGN